MDKDDKVSAYFFLIMGVFLLGMGLFVWKVWRDNAEVQTPRVDPSAETKEEWQVEPGQDKG